MELLAVDEQACRVEGGGWFVRMVERQCREIIQNKFLDLLLLPKLLMDY